MQDTLLHTFKKLSHRHSNKINVCLTFHFIPIQYIIICVCSRGPTQNCVLLRSRQIFFVLVDITEHLVVSSNVSARVRSDVFIFCSEIYFLWPP